jgi:hypothetical protein
MSPIRQKRERERGREGGRELPTVGSCLIWSVIKVK